MTPEKPLRDTHWVVPASLEGQLLDGALRTLAKISWSNARRLIETGKVMVGGALVVSHRRRVVEGECIELRLGAPRPQTLRRQQLEAELLVYVDASVVVANKPAGISTVPFGDESPAEQATTLDALVRETLRRQDRIRGRAPLGVVQRLDKATSGLMVFARTVAAKKHLAQQLRYHTAHRLYVAIVYGNIQSQTFRSFLVEDRGDGLRGGAPVSARRGQLAITHVEALERFDQATLVSCKLETGRTHQIRIHLAEAGHPLVGETVYVRDYTGPLMEAPRLMLHATELGFRHPMDERLMRFHLHPPEDFERTLSTLRRQQHSRRGA